MIASASRAGLILFITGLIARYLPPLLVSSIPSLTIDNGFLQMVRFLPFGVLLLTWDTLIGVVIKMVTSIRYNWKIIRRIAIALYLALAGLLVMTFPSDMHGVYLQSFKISSVATNILLFIYWDRFVRWTVPARWH